MNAVVSYFTTPNGDEMAMLPRAELERLTALAEEAEDIRAFDEATAALDSGEDELLPADFVERLLNAHSPLREWRKHRGMTQAALAKASGVRQATISTLESRGANSEPAYKTVRALAGALGVDPEDLI
ncbi:helix-turn-helix transcriptional regulator [Marinihelvus fidelis]|uniref:Helix-turn-helix transcriptional regulator n=1 Tax=Marinihelvus fidelis TaxID=2613842 RepID=A0A5N0T682_9GAMM|nr:helix-turn-helix transcriptional regulator [Marinihelvus fidelis]KAA9130321.1 helix-turn-helix transcriptional regulator [Marinihelvus fidelis]